MAGFRLDDLGDGVVALRADPASADAPEDLVEHALTAGARRVEAEVAADEHDLRRRLQRAGLRPEGLSRGRGRTAAGEPLDVLRLARLHDDPPPGTRASHLALLNAALPLKRVIAQGLVTGGHDRVLLCELTYKQEWDLPGGVVDPHESPAFAVRREIGEELGVDLPVRRLLVVDWLPPYRQWDDALLLGFDLGEHPGLVEEAVLEAAEIRAVHWCGPEEVAARMAPYAARLVGQLVQARAEGRVRYVEDGYPTG